MKFWLELGLWSSALTIILVTVGYPLLLILVSPFARRDHVVEDAEPSVSLVIAAHNEEVCIEGKLKNALALDYPRERLQIIVASDGSTDLTNEIVQSFASRGVVLRAFPRMGKTGMQNLTARSVTSDILVFSDANAMYRPDAIRKLVRNFADSSVACVTGQLVYDVDPQSAGAGEDSYWGYEKFLKKCESDCSSAIGANGSIYAVRRSDYIEIDNDLISDLVEPLALVRSGKRVVYEADAVSIEAAAGTYEIEFRRKVRILTRSIKGVLRMRSLMNPFQHGVFSLQLIVHKLLRYLVPLFLLTGLASLASLTFVDGYRVLFVLVSTVVAVSIAVGRLVEPRQSNAAIRACHLLYYYLMVNYALVLAWTNIVRGRRMAVWVPERTEA